MRNKHGDKTVLYHRDQTAAHPVLTDKADSPGFENLQERLMDSARLGSGKRLDLHINPLVAAASELLVEMVSLADVDQRTDIRSLNVRLSEQVKLFELTARHHAIENDQLLVARYVLCTVLDETVLTSAWGSSSDWSTMSLLSRFHNETFGGEKFFQLLERLSGNPRKHLPMLELMYLCLALGFEGKYRVAHRGDTELEVVRDRLYRQIRQSRGDIPRMLSPQWQGSKPTSVNHVRIVPFWLVVLFTAMTLTIMYSGFAWVLGKQRETVLKPYQSFESAAPVLQP